MGIFDKLKKVFTKDKEQEKDVQLYTEGLEKTRKEFVSKLNILNLKYTKVNDAYFDELEEITELLIDGTLLEAVEKEIPLLRVIPNPSLAL